MFIFSLLRSLYLLIYVSSFCTKIVKIRFIGAFHILYIFVKQCFIEVLQWLTVDTEGITEGLIEGTVGDGNMGFFIPLLAGAGVAGAVAGGVSSVYNAYQNYQYQKELERSNNDYFRLTGKTANYPRLSGRYVNYAGAILGGVSGVTGAFSHGVYSAGMMFGNELYESDDKFDSFYGGYY